MAPQVRVNAIAPGPILPPSGQHDEEALRRAASFTLLGRHGKPENITDAVLFLATADYVPFPKVARIVQELYPDRKVVNREVPDWVMHIMAYFGGPIRQIINDIGNEKVFDGSRGEALMGHKYIDARTSIHDTAESVINLGLKFSIA